MDSPGPYRYRRNDSPHAQSNAWFSSYLSPPVRELLDAGPAAQRRLQSPHRADVCILFTDIRGFTDLSPTLDLDALFRTVDACIGRQIRLIEHYNGYVDSFTGDGLMAVFEGTGMEENACRCALEVVARALPVLRSRDSTVMPIGAGLHRGRVAMGTLGAETRRTYTSIGDTVNRAARLAGFAWGSELMISNRIREGVAADVARQFVPVPVNRLRRDMDPVAPVYRSRRN
jgi:class 3 adenylate cyclase